MRLRLSNSTKHLFLMSLLLVGLVCVTAPSAGASTVTLAVAGDAPMPIETRADTVGELLASQRLDLAASDVVRPPVAAPIRNGLSISVTRVRTEIVADVSSIAPRSRRVSDPTLAYGATRTVRDGDPGALERRYSVTLTDGRETGRKLLSERVKDKPRDRVVAVGTRKEQPAPGKSTYAGGSVAYPQTGDGLNWSALAMCESGGNPRAVSASGAYRGLYQFSLSTWRSVGGSGDPAAASPAEQTARAQILHARSGRGQWPVCGRRL